MPSLWDPTQHCPIQVAFLQKENPLRNKNCNPTHMRAFLRDSAPEKHQRFDIKAVSAVNFRVVIHSVVSDSMTPWATASQSSLSFTISWSSPKLMSIELLSNYFMLCCPLLLLPSIFPSIKVFSNDSALCIRWPKYWSFSFSISPSNEYSGLISFWMDWLDLLAIQETLKSLLKHHSSKASILQHSAFFMVQHSHSYMTMGKIIVWLDGPLLAK